MSKFGKLFQKEVNKSLKKQEQALSDHETRKQDQLEEWKRDCLLEVDGRRARKMKRLREESK